jgi:hypothetical protein
MPKDHPGQRLYLELLQAFKLTLRKIAHLRLGEFDVIYLKSGQLLDTAGDFVITQTIALAIESIELDRILANRCIAARRNVMDDPLDGVSYGRVLPGDCFPG